MELLKAQAYSFSYPGSKDFALQEIDITVNEGDFAVVFGRSGSGKSTLLRCIKEELRPTGNESGVLSVAIPSTGISVVFQDPNTQLVCSAVIDDLVFYMENLGYDQNIMHKRLAETVNYFGIEHLLHKSPLELSGGQKQLVVLCAALMTEPKLLLLDEPVSQLDPIASREFFATLARVNEDFGVTIFMTEHRLDNALPYCDRLVYMDEGRIVHDSSARETLALMSSRETPGEYLFVPAIPRASSKISGGRNLCLTTKEFKNFDGIRGISAGHENAPADDQGRIVKLDNVFFSYTKHQNYVLRNLYFEIKKGERLCLLGGNGSGKSTMLRLLAGILKPTFGSIKGEKTKIGYMPQDLRSYFRFKTVREEIEFSLAGREPDSELLCQLGLDRLLDRHPFDISGGETGKLALYCLFSIDPQLVILDEPTKGLDPYAKQLLAKILRERSITVLCSTHDLEFAADFASRCAMLFDGSISFTDRPGKFFSYHKYYTTPINLATRHISDNLITVEDVICAWQKGEDCSQPV